VNSETEETESRPDRLNYFNYFTEVEEEFVRRRGKPLMISPLDWALVESWKDAGMPLHLVLRSINEAFDSYDKRPSRRQKVNSILYCEQVVESNFAAYRTGQVGGTAQAGSEDDSEGSQTKGQSDAAFSKSELLAFLARCSSELADAAAYAGGSHLEAAIARGRSRLAEIALEIESARRIDSEGIERNLDSIDRMMLEAIRSESSEDTMNDLMKEAQSQLRSYKKKMDKAFYEQTVQNFITRRLREANHIPRLSLFYMDL
jgi:hypothetical protein